MSDQVQQLRDFSLERKCLFGHGIERVFKTWEKPGCQWRLIRLQAPIYGWPDGFQGLSFINSLG
jgi:hypothetical protein